MQTIARILSMIARIGSCTYRENNNMTIRSEIRWIKILKSILYFG